MIQRKILTPSDFATLEEVKDSLRQFENYYEAAAKPFKWKFTRRDLAKLLSKLIDHGEPLAKAA